MSNTNTEVLTTAYEKLQGAITQSDTVLSNLQEAIEKGNLDNYATVSSLEEKASMIYVDTKIGNMGNVKTFKGSCDFASLPTTATTNDYWYVTDKSTNYCWNGLNWIDIGDNLNIGENTINRKMIDEYIRDTIEVASDFTKFDNTIPNASTLNNKTYIVGKKISKNTNINYVKTYISTSSPNSGGVKVGLYKLENTTLTLLDTIGEFDTKISNQEYTFKIDSFVTQDCYLAISTNNANIGFVQGDYAESWNNNGVYFQTDSGLPSTISDVSWGNNTFLKVNINVSNPIIKEVKKLIAIESNVNKNVITVGKSGCDYINIQDAVNSIEDDAEDNPYVILVMPGIYGRFYSYSTKTSTSRGRGVARYISIIGIDNRSCIVKDKISSTFESNGVLKNLHIITTDETVPSDTTEFYDSLSGYGLHIDQAGYSECIVENCVIESYKHCAIGSGTKSNQTIKLIRNKLISHKDGESGLFYHNNHWQVTNNKNQNLYLEGNYCYADSGYGIYLNDTLVGQTQYPSLVNVTMLNNIVGSGDKGYGDNAIRKQDITGDYISGTNFKLDYGFGNNATLLNS